MPPKMPSVADLEAGLAQLPPSTFAKLEARIKRSQFPPYNAASSQRASPLSAETFDWDVVSMQSYPAVNYAIAVQGSSPPHFSAEDDIDDNHFQAGADFSDWQLSQGGNGNHVHILTPFTSAKLSLNHMPPIEIGGGYAVIEVQLHYVDADAKGALPLGHIMKNLVTKAEVEPDGQYEVAVVKILYDEEPTVTVSILFESLFTLWLQTSLNEFSHTFLTVEINPDAVPGEPWSFVDVSYASYAVWTGAKIDQCVLSALAVTSGRDPDGRLQQTKGDVLNEEQNAAFLIKGKNLLPFLVQPAVPLLVGGLESDNLVLSTNSRRLTSKEVFDLDPVRDGDDVMEYLLSCRTFEIRLDPTFFSAQIVAATDIGDEYATTVSIMYRYTIALVGAGESKSIGFLTEENPTEEVSYAYPDHDEDNPLDPEMVAKLKRISKTVLDRLRTKADVIVRSFCAALLTGAPVSDLEILAKICTSDAPSVEELVSRSVGRFGAPSLPKFELDELSMDNELLMRGRHDLA